MTATLFQTDRIQQRFEAFHSKNPRLYRLFKQFARDIKRAGYEHYSADAILHRVRWHVDIETRGGDGYSINNNYSSRYARKLMDECPEFAGFFRLRELRST